MEVLKWIGCSLAAALFIGAVWGIFLVGYFIGVVVFWAVTIGVAIYTCTKMFRALFRLLFRK